MNNPCYNGFMTILLKSCETRTATIYVGRKLANGVIMPIEKITDVVQRAVDDLSWCVTVTETTYVYTGGNEPGVAIGIINYPRFPEDENALYSKANCLAIMLAEECGQCRISAVMGDTTWMYSNEENIAKWEEAKEEKKKDKELNDMLDKINT